MAPHKQYEATLLTCTTMACRKDIGDMQTVGGVLIHLILSYCYFRFYPFPPVHAAVLYFLPHILVNGIIMSSLYFVATSMYYNFPYLLSKL